MSTKIDNITIKFDKKLNLFQQMKMMEQIEKYILKDYKVEMIFVEEDYLRIYGPWDDILIDHIKWEIDNYFKELDKWSGLIGQEIKHISERAAYIIKDLVERGEIKIGEKDNEKF